MHRVHRLYSNRGLVCVEAMTAPGDELLPQVAETRWELHSMHDTWRKSCLCVQTETWSFSPTAGDFFTESQETCGFLPAQWAVVISIWHPLQTGCFLLSSYSEDFGFRKGVNNIRSNQFWLPEPVETYTERGEGAISCFFHSFFMF